MSNEEKILALLEKQDTRFEKIEAQLAEQGKQLAELTSKVDSLEGKVVGIDKKVNSLAKKIDHDVVPYVKLLDEDYSRIARRVAAMEKAK